MGGLSDEDVGRIDQLLAVIAAVCPDYKVTLVMRSEDDERADVVLTQDDPASLLAALERNLRPEKLTRKRKTDA